MSIPRTIV